MHLTTLSLLVLMACGDDRKISSDAGPSVGDQLGDSLGHAARPAESVYPEYWPASFGIGRGASPEEIRAWDIDVMPDGTGLPPGSGTVARGATLYNTRCVSCHGPTGTEGPFDRLVGRIPEDGFPFGRDPALLAERTIGSYWPYATTVFDYIQRAMPQDAPGSLTPDEVYSLTAFLLYENKIIPEDAVMNAQTLPNVEMPARERFELDNRRGGAEIR